MSELKAMGLVTVVTVFLSTILNVVLLMLHAGGEALALSLCLMAICLSISLTLVIKRYATVAEKREREERILAR